MPLYRRNTFDEAIWHSVQYEYLTATTSFVPSDLVLDIGAHTGAFCELAARRGATVLGYEANRDNFALAAINLHDLDAVTLRHAAVWRSDVPPGRLTFTPSADTANTGGGSVLFRSSDVHWATMPCERWEGPTPEAALSTHEVAAAPLDDILAELGAVRFMKIDVEGAEFPILLTANQLDRVAAIAGEYHELTDDGMAALAPEALVGDERYSAELLRRRLAEAGFEEVTFVPDRGGRGFFSATRRRGSQPAGRQ